MATLTTPVLDIATTLVHWLFQFSAGLLGDLMTMIMMARLVHKRMDADVAAGRCPVCKDPLPEHGHHHDDIERGPW